MVKYVRRLKIHQRYELDIFRKPLQYIFVPISCPPRLIRGLSLPSQKLTAAIATVVLRSEFNVQFHQVETYFRV